MRDFSRRAYGRAVLVRWSEAIDWCVRLDTLSPDERVSGPVGHHKVATNGRLSSEEGAAGREPPDAVKLMACVGKKSNVK